MRENPTSWTEKFLSPWKDEFKISLCDKTQGKFGPNGNRDEGHKKNIIMAIWVKFFAKTVDIQKKHVKSII